MDFYRIRGGSRLTGNVRISGSKNAALPLISASLLLQGKVTLQNIPSLQDVHTMFELLREIGAVVEYDSAQKIAYIDSSNLKNHKVPYDLVKKMRASFIVAGPLISIFRKASISLPGGCAIGARPVDIHLKAFKKIGITYKNESGYINLKKDGRKERALDKNIEIIFDFPSVGATQNIIMASIFEKRTIKIINWAKEPEINALIDFLNLAGANIKTGNNNELIIKGVETLKSDITFKNIPDRIEAGTFLIAALITRSDLKIEHVESSHIKNILDKCEECGAKLHITPKTVSISSPKVLKGIKIKTLPHPGFPTDMQAQFCSLLATADEASIIEEAIFENRFMHIPELCRMGADIDIENNTAFIKGKISYTGAPVMASDLRAGAALVLAALAADGETVVNRIYHIDRGYEDFDLKLKNLGADIKRITPEKKA